MQYPGRMVAAFNVDREVVPALDQARFFYPIRPRDVMGYMDRFPVTLPLVLPDDRLDLEKLAVSNVNAVPTII